MGTGSVLGNNQNSGQAGYGPSYGNTSINQPFQNGAATPQGTTPILPTQPRPFYGMGNDIRNVQGTVLPTDADYQGQNTAVQMFGGMPQTLTPPMPMQPRPFYGMGDDVRYVQGQTSPSDADYQGPTVSRPVLPVGPSNFQNPNVSRPVLPVGPTNFENSTVSRPVLPPPRMPMTQPISQTAVSPAKQRAMARALRRR